MWTRAGILLSCLMIVLGGPAARAGSPSEKTAIFAGGCFWCMESVLEKKDGVREVVSGYTGGTGADPDYHDYAAKGHVEAVRVLYDPARVSYEELLEVFWDEIDPTDAGGQFADRGAHYRTVIFYENPDQKKEAEVSRRKRELSGRYDGPIVTEILPAGKFYPAEEGHQDYSKKEPLRYRLYRMGSGREGYHQKIRSRIPSRDSEPA